MASIHKKSESKFWMCSFKLPDGKWTLRSTKIIVQGKNSSETQVNREKALRICMDYEQATRDATQGRLAEGQAREIIGRIYQIANKESLPQSTVKEYLEYMLGSSRVLLYEQFKDEAEFREKFVKPLLNRLGYYGVSEQHGTQEFGKDFVFSELHRLGGMRHYAAQVKHEERINQGTSVDGLLSQVRQAFAKPFKRADSPRDCHVSAVYIFNSGEITANAKEQLLSELERERYGDNVHFLDGERLKALNEWATLQSDANARARLLGLRSALRFIIATLGEYQLEGKPGFQPMFIQGIELYLSEPVNCDDQLLVSLFKLWQQLQGVEVMRKILFKYLTDAIGLEKNAPKLKQLAQDARTLAIEICQKIDAAIEKMKPLGGS